MRERVFGFIFILNLKICQFLRIFFDYFGMI